MLHRRCFTHSLTLAICVLIPAWQMQAADAGRYIEAVRAFAETTIEHGRDTYGPKETPLFVDGLHAETLEPVRWQCRGETWVLCNFASQQPLLRILDGLTALTGESKYRKAAEEATAYALRELTAPSGLLYWGGHLAWDLQADKPVGQYADVHELKGHQPYYRLMWRVDPQGTRKLTEAIWAGHILDWSLLDYNRHASVKRDRRARWDHNFAQDKEIPFAIEGSNLSFVNVTPPLMHTGVMLAILGRNADALRWTERLALRWQQARDPVTGLSGGQLSYRRHDRAQDALGHVHPEINEAKIVASYHQSCRYHHLPLAQMQAAGALIEAGGQLAETGRRFLQWASDDLRTYGEHCYHSETGTFIAMMTDGTPLRWREARSDYYVPSSFAPRRPDGSLLWGYALAWRLTRDSDHWNMTRALARHLHLGDLGDSNGQGRSPDFATQSRDWRAAYALLELYRATGDDAILRLACRIGDNCIAIQKPTGLFPRSRRNWARTGDEMPLMLMHLAGAIAGKQQVLPAPIFDSRFFHCEYHGPLDEGQRKRADKRTYDHLVFYGD